MKYLPKIIVVFSLLFFFFFLFSTPEAKAAPTKPSDIFYNITPESLTQEEQAAEKQDKSGEVRLYDKRVIDRQRKLAIWGAIEEIGGCIYTDPKLCENKQESALGFLAKAMGTLYQYPPASGIAYGYDLLQNAGLIKPAYAQGIGFVGLMPLLPLWKASRNIAYTILVIVMIVIGFMVIFRMKIDPKTVISIQAALPKIIITLLLITFSYPIAGFFIDLMYLVMAIIIQLMANAVAPLNLAMGTDFIKDAATQQQEFMAPGNWWKLLTAVFSFGMIPAALQQFFGGSIVNIEASGGAVGIIAVLLAKLTGILATVGLASISATIGLAILIPVGIIVLVVLLGLLFTFIRLFMLLLNSYIQLLMAVVLAPLLLLKEAIPGQSAFTEWIQNIIANLVVFPATVAVIYLSWIFTSIACGKNLWSAPLIPSCGGGDLMPGNPLAVFIGLGIIFMAPNLVASIKKAFHPKPAIPVTAGSAFAPAATGIQGTMGAMQSFYYFKMSGSSIPFIGKRLFGEQSHGATSSA